MGGAIISENDIELINCDIFENSAKNAGGGLIIAFNSDYISSSRFKNNSPDDFTQFINKS